MSVSKRPGKLRLQAALEAKLASGVKKGPTCGVRRVYEELGGDDDGASSDAVIFLSFVAMDRSDPKYLNGRQLQEVLEDLGIKYLKQYQIQNHRRGECACSRR